jgi:hypothetical protein
MTPQRLFIDGVALWAPRLPDWAVAAAALRGEALPPGPPQPPARPTGARLSANERRRAPEGVKLALDVAEAAVAGSGHDPAQLASVFASAHADLAIVDALCTTLAADPLLLSPTRFHHSVHNAASGYWGIATGAHAPSTALAADGHSWALGWIEAAAQVAVEGRPVLLVGFDTEACGALASVNHSQGLLGVAVVMAPTRSAHTRWVLDWRIESGSDDNGGAAATPLRSPAAQALAGNAMAGALPLMELLAGAGPGTVRLALPPGRAVVLTRL